MFLVTFNIMWSFTFFFFSLYLLLVISIIFYLLPSLSDLINHYKNKTNQSFKYITGFDCHLILITPVFLFWLNTFCWTSAPLSSWFGHIIFSAFVIKISYLIFFMFYLIITIYTSSSYFTTKTGYDFMITCFNFFFWILLLFYANSIFTVIFFIEILSTLIFLLLITSIFSTTHFYKNLNLNLHNYFTKSLPFFFLQTLLFFFWTSLISSLNLFFFLLLFYLKFLTFDWNIFEFIFLYLITFDNFKSNVVIVFIWFNLLFCIFLKCGLVPFYFWKPVFFKGISLNALAFYILFFYFFIFLFFLHFLLIYTNEIFFFCIQVNILFLLFGMLILLFILCEAYYIKTFLALSSILNTLFIFLILNSNNFVDFFFI